MNSELFERVLRKSQDHLTDEIFELYLIANSNEKLDENTEHLLEMSKLRKNETGLPVDIWVDEGRTFSKSGHSKRIKFQGDKGDPNTRNWVPLTISENPEIPVQSASHNLNAQEMASIKLFIRKNLTLLLKLGDEIGIVEFSKNMKKL